MDFTARLSPRSAMKLRPRLRDRLQVRLAEAAANRVTGGLYGLLRTSHSLAEGKRRQEVARHYAERYRAPLSGGTPGLQVRSRYHDAILGSCAAFVVSGFERFERRQTTLLAARTLGLVGSACQFVPGVGTALGTGLGVLSKAVSTAVKLGGAYGMVRRGLSGDRGQARVRVAGELWWLGQEAHFPTLQFLTELGVLDGPQGELSQRGFFDPSNRGEAVGAIAAQLEAITDTRTLRRFVTGRP